MYTDSSPKSVQQSLQAAQSSTDMVSLQDAIEERIIERAMQKLKLDQMVIQAGRAQPAAKGECDRRTAQFKPSLIQQNSCAKQGGPPGHDSTRSGQDHQFQGEVSTIFLAELATRLIPNVPVV
jgi:hypothetical protein